MRSNGSKLRGSRLLAMLLLAGLAVPSLAQQGQPGEPALSPAVERAIAADYLSDSERAALRVFHGQWTDADLVEPALAARAALLAGDYGSPAFDAEGVDPLDRAEAMVLRGDVRDALALIEDNDSLRALRLRARGLELLGDLAGVARVTDAGVERLASEAIEDPAALTDGARLLAIRARTIGVDPGAGEYELITSLLARVRDDLDRLHWPARLAEAQLLDARDNRLGAQQAITEALALNPRAAEAWATLGELQVRGFNFDQADAIADRLDSITGTLREGAQSPHAGLIRARAMLRQREPAKAAEHADGVLTAYPAMRGALALRAAVAAVYNDAATEAALLARLDELSPGTALGHYEAGVQLSDWRQYAPAAAHLRAATELQPAWPEAWIELGLLAMQAADDGEAIAALTRATELDPFNRRARNSLTLAQKLAGFETIETDHFLIRYEAGPDELLARVMGPELERIHDRVSGAARDGLDHEPAERTVIDLMPDHATFAVRITGMPDIFTIAASTGPAIAMESPRPGPGRTQRGYDWARVLQHEYVHTVSLSRTSNRIPHWFTEAAAVYLEDAPWDERRARMLVASLRDDTLYPLDTLSLGFIRPDRPNGRALAYAQSAWVYEFIVERFGSEAPLRLMDGYAQGLTQREAFEDVLGLPQDDLEAEFLNWAHGRARAWGLLPADGVPSAGELLEQYEGDGSVSIETLDDLLVQHPEHPQLVEMRAKAELDRRSGRPAPEMADLLRTWARVQPIADQPRRMLVLLARRDGGIDPADAEAADHLRHLDAREQYSAAFATELSRLAMRRGDFGDGLHWAKRAVRIEPFDAPTRELAAMAAIRAGDLREARLHVEALIAIEPGRAIHQQRLDAINARLDR